MTFDFVKTADCMVTISFIGIEGKGIGAVTPANSALSLIKSTTELGYKFVAMDHAVICPCKLELDQTPDEEFAICPACGDPIDYCQGHGSSGDPVGFAILMKHDDGKHEECVGRSDCKKEMRSL